VNGAKSKPLQFTVRRFMLWIVGFAILLALVRALHLGVESAREAANRSDCSSRLFSIRMALRNYHDTYGSFPPAYVPDANGKPMHSWRALILPFLLDRAAGPEAG
jgi:hypothetical protein